MPGLSQIAAGREDHGVVFSKEGVSARGTHGPVGSARGEAGIAHRSGGPPEPAAARGTEPLAACTLAAAYTRGSGLRLSNHRGNGGRQRRELRRNRNTS